jgi:thiamine-phosphate pyrophosphorylase
VLDAAAVERLGEGGLRAACDAGVDWIQLRDRSRDGAELLAAAECAVAGARASARAVRVVVNRRADVARAAGADGVHLGFDALSAARARALLGAPAWIGVSLHDPAAVGAERDANYVHLAPIFAPLSRAARADPARPRGSARGPARAAVTVLAQGGHRARQRARGPRGGRGGVAVTGTIGSGPPTPRAQCARYVLPSMHERAAFALLARCSPSHVPRKFRAARRSRAKTSGEGRAPTSSAAASTVAEAVTPSSSTSRAIIKCDDRRNEVTGSGLIVTADGARSSQRARRRQAEKITGERAGPEAEVSRAPVGTDRQTDIALLRIDHGDDPPFAAARLSPEPVRVASGCSRSAIRTASTERLARDRARRRAATSRSPDLLNDFIQTEALIDRGSSGWTARRPRRAASSDQLAWSGARASASRSRSTPRAR